MLSTRSSLFLNCGRAGLLWFTYSTAAGLTTDDANLSYLIAESYQRLPESRRSKTL